MMNGIQLLERAKNNPRHQGIWGNWHYSFDGYLNLIVKPYDTIEEPFYAINLNEIQNFQHIWNWIVQIKGKNKKVYGETVSDDLIMAFEDLLLHGLGIRHGESNATAVDGKKMVKKYSRHLTSSRRRNVSLKQRVTILERDNYTCQMCGARAPQAVLHIDHKHPFSRGGQTEDSNLWALCSDCNIGKSDRIITLPDD